MRPGKNDAHIELLELADSGIHVATYWTKLLPKKTLERKLHRAVVRARQRLELRDVKAGKETTGKAQ